MRPRSTSIHILGFFISLLLLLTIFSPLINARVDKHQLDNSQIADRNEGIDKFGHINFLDRDEHVEKFTPVDRTVRTKMKFNDTLFVNVDSVTSIDIDPTTGYVWYGTGDGGVVELQYQTNHRYLHSRGNGVASNFVNDIVVENEFIWIGSSWDGGISKYQKTTGRWVAYTPKNSNVVSDSVVDLELDGGDIIWIATSYSGVNKYEKSTQQLDIV